MTRKRNRSTRAGGSRSSAINARRFLARRLIYEAEGELRVYDLPDAIPDDEAIARFEQATRLQYDADLGIWREPRGEAPHDV